MTDHQNTAGHIAKLDLEDPRAWATLLEPGEKIMWQSRPEKYRINSAQARLMQLAGLACVGAAFYLVLVPSVVPAAGGKVLGLILAALALSLGPVVYHALRHRNLLYTLTNQRALISKTPLGPTGWVDTRAWQLETEAQPMPETGAIGTLWFGEEEIQRKHGTITRRVGFHHIADPWAVGEEMAAAIRKLRDRTAKT